jgi:hypothetical protein
MVDVVSGRRLTLGKPLLNMTYLRYIQNVMPANRRAEGHTIAVWIKSLDGLELGAPTGELQFSHSDHFVCFQQPDRITFPQACSFPFVISNVTGSSFRTHLDGPLVSYT